MVVVVYRGRGGEANGEGGEDALPRSSTYTAAHRQGEECVSSGRMTTHTHTNSYMHPHTHTHTPCLERVWLTWDRINNKITDQVTE